MRICFAIAIFCLPAAGDPSRKITNVVRADVRTGRLVRGIAVPAAPVREKVVKPAAPGPVRPKFGPDTTVREIAAETARRHGVEPALVESVIEVESGYNPFALSPKGAEGLMQLMPATARRFGVGNSFDPGSNIEGGVRYLKYLQGLYGDSDLRRVLAAYNAGEGAVARYNGIPRYRETESYVYQVGRKLGQKRAAAKAEPPTPAPAQPETPGFRPVEQFRDAEGRLYLKTR